MTGTGPDDDRLLANHPVLMKLLIDIGIGFCVVVLVGIIWAVTPDSVLGIVGASVAAVCYLIMGIGNGSVTWPHRQTWTTRCGSTIDRERLTRKLNNAGTIIPQQTRPVILLLRP